MMRSELDEIRPESTALVDMGTIRRGLSGKDLSRSWIDCIITTRSRLDPMDLPRSSRPDVTPRTS
jgi:hypothetical protein